MSGLIEKITLYDLLGYALPGSILLGMLAFAGIISSGNMESIYSTYKDALWAIFLVLLLLGYVTGMLIAEITDCFIQFFRDSLSFEVKQYFKNCCLNYRQIEQALSKAGFLQSEKKVQGPDDVMQYLSSMYGTIQSDANYNRLHNYASAKLICKNMAFVSYSIAGIIAVSSVWRQHGVMFMPNCRLALELLAMAVFWGIGCLFKRRRKKMHKKTYFYTVVWFVEKYSHSN